MGAQSLSVITGRRCFVRRGRIAVALVLLACDPRPSTSDGDGSATDEGCGDGVGQPGVWCYERIVIEQNTGHALGTGDLDGDGRDEIVTWDSVAGEVRVLWWHADGTPTLGPPVASALHEGSDVEVLVDDVTGDGIGDVLVATTAAVHVHENLGAGELGTDERFEVPCTDGLPFPVRAFELDQAAPAELLVGCRFDVLPFQRVDGGFVQASDPVMTGTCPTTALAIGDLDADGIDDVVAGGACTQYMPDVPVAVLRGTGSGLAPAQQYSAGPNGAVDLALGDFDGDAILDVVVSNLAAGQLELLRGLGEAALEPAGAFALPCDAACESPANALRMATADLDGNGDDELLMTIDGPTEGLHWVADPSPSATVEPLDPEGISPVIGDFNTDGWPDVAYTVRQDDRYAVVLLASSP